MKIAWQILLGYFLLVAIAAWFVLNIFMEEIKPSVRQSTEDALVDTAQILAQIATQDINSGKIQNGALALAVKKMQQSQVNASISGIPKTNIALNVYVTDGRGTVLYDSTGQNLGRDFSQWNDVYLTLKGEYGARSTRLDPNDGTTSIMYVAAPIWQNERIIGSLTVSKPNITLMPTISRAENRIQWAGAVLLGIALLIGGAIAWWVSRSIARLQTYAHKVAQGETVLAPQFRSPELAQLSGALEKMRQQLEGKAYVEQYVHSLTHELKSPLTAIRSSAELLQEHPPTDVRERFTQNIHEQTTRLQLLIDRLLQLASIERTPSFATAPVALNEIIGNATHSVQPILEQRKITVKTTLTDNPTVQVDKLMLTQALVNVLDNAIDFSADGAAIDIYDEASLRGHHLLIRDYGVGIPDYAIDKIFDRFYSLARPHTHKSTGLGLSFVREVMRKHGGEVEIENHAQGGVVVRLVLPK